MSVIATEPDPAAEKAPAAESPWRRFAGEFAESKLALLGLAMLVTIVLVAVCAPLVSPQNPYDLEQLDIMANMLPPGSLLGSEIGRAHV